MELFDRLLSPKTTSAGACIKALQQRGMTLEQIAAALPPDEQGRPVSRVTLSKVLHGNYSGAQLVERLRGLVEGKPSPAPRPRQPKQPTSIRATPRPGQTRNRQQKNSPRSPIPDATPASRYIPPDTQAPADVGKAAYGAGRPARWTPDTAGHIIKEPPLASPSSPSSLSSALPPSSVPTTPTAGQILASHPSPTSPRRRLREAYTELRQLGYTDAQAQAELARERDTAKRQTEAVVADVVMATLARRYEQEARRRLAMAGCYREDQVRPAALQFAGRAMHQKQPARLPDEWVQATRLQIAVPSQRR
jgi:hypothetical protein